MRIAVVGPAHFGIAEPFAGGLEAHTSALALGLDRLGHSVTVFVGDATSRQPAGVHVEPILNAPIDFTGSTRSDNAMPPDRCLREDVAYRNVLLRLAQDQFDVVHNNSLHYILPGLAEALSTPMVHTLHTPPFPWLQQAHICNRAENGAVVSVSKSLAAEWLGHGVASKTILNGVAIKDRPASMQRKGPGRNAVWVGRLVPEKGAHLAIQAVRLAGFQLDLYGPSQHNEYFASQIEPLLGRGVHWHGHSDHRTIQRALTKADVGVVTPCWEEPFGLTTAEMLAAGLPVAAFDRGATREILSKRTGCLVRAGDVRVLAVAIRQAAQLSSRDCVAQAKRLVCQDRMLSQYVNLYHELIFK